MKQFRVLVVDDEPRIIKFLKIKLEASGYEMLTAGTGLEGVEKLQPQEPPACTRPCYARHRRFQDTKTGPFGIFATGNYPQR